MITKFTSTNPFENIVSNPLNKDKFGKRNNQ